MLHHLPVVALQDRLFGEVKALRHRGLAALAEVLGLGSSGQPRQHWSLPDPDRLASHEKPQG
jgi:hypothetical protein